MIRVLALLVLVAMAGPVAAQPPILTTAKLEKETLLVTQMRVVPVTRSFTVEVLVNGKAVQEVRTVVVNQTESFVQQVPLSAVKATDVAGKPIPAEKLAGLLKEKTGVVLFWNGKELDDEHRKMFKEGVVFLQMEAPQPVPKGVPKLG